MTSVDTVPPPLTRLESQPDDLMGSADVDGASALLQGHTGVALGDGAMTSKPNGSESSPGALDEAKPNHSVNGEAETPASNGPPDFPTGTEKPGVLPPLQPEVKKNNKGVPWYDPYPIHAALFLFPRQTHNPASIC